MTTAALESQRRSTFFTKFKALFRIHETAAASKGCGSATAMRDRGRLHQGQRRQEHTADKCGGTKVQRTQLEVRALAAQLRAQLFRQAVGAQGVPASSGLHTRSPGRGPTFPQAHVFPARVVGRHARLCASAGNRALRTCCLQ